VLLFLREAKNFHCQWVGANDKRGREAAISRVKRGIWQRHSKKSFGSFLQKRTASFLSSHLP
jgi:hypothetical protein